MDYKKLQILFFLAILFIVFAINLVVFLPYLYALIFAGILAVIFHPLFKLMLRHRFFKKMPGFASILIVLLVLLIMLLPLVTLGLLMVKETTQLYAHVLQGESSYVLIEKVETVINKFLPQANFDVSAEFNTYSKSALKFMVENVGPLFSSILGLFFSFFLTLFALYYLLKDGRKFRKALIIFSPLSDRYDKRILKKLMLAVNSVVKGTLLVSLIQGVLAGLGFWIFGVPNPVLLGAITVIAALIPAIGTGLVILPAVIFLFVTSSFLGAIGLIIWGLVLVGLIDNLLRPKLIEKDINIHPLLIFLSAIGGISIFGPFGFLLGPLILSLLFAMLDIYKEEFSDYLQSSR